MSHFESVEDAVNYGVSELLDTLQDDYQRMTYDKYERSHYRPSDRQEMRRRISDLRKCEYMMRNASLVDEMHSILREMDRWLQAKRKRQTASELLANLHPKITKVVMAAQRHPSVADPVVTS
jgi:cell division septum initiation protein DivIVA